MKQEYPYIFTLIMAVYNVELYLKEAIESVIAQSIGINRLQLILVDDGSPDNSGAICDAYAARYPDNIFVIHKENGGVSSARNRGLELAQGQYVNFMDSDDKLSPNACKKVYEFLLAHPNEADVVTIPVVFFDGATGEHILNHKFKKGSRVIDLKEEPGAIQLAVNSAFIRLSAIRQLQARFNPKLLFAEDAAFLQPILWQKEKLGVVAGCKYLYRKRSSGPPSAIQKSTTKKEWWLDYLTHFPLYLIDRAKRELGQVPRFVQYTLAYDLQWRVRQRRFPNHLLDEAEEQEYLGLLKECYANIDDDVILAQRYTQTEHKYAVLCRKYGQGQEKIEQNDIALIFGKDTSIRLSDCAVTLDFLKLGEDSCTLEGKFCVLPISYHSLRVGVAVNGSFYPGEIIDRGGPGLSLGEEICRFIGFRVTVPLDKTQSYRITFRACLDGHSVDYRHVSAGKHFPVGTVHTAAYYAHRGWIAAFDQAQLELKQKTLFRHIGCECAFLLDLWKTNVLGGRKAIPVRLLRHMLKLFKRRQIWLISDRINKADDNGEALFLYLREKKPEHTDVYFLLSRNSGDYPRLAEQGKVVVFFSTRHKLLHLLCDCNISASADDFMVNPFSGHQEGYRDLLDSCRYVFLQHGVIKDDLSGWLNRYSKNISGFAVSAIPEYQSILDGNYFYSPNQVWLTGLPRFDRLYHREENCIALMPTWRMYLMLAANNETGIRLLKDGFEQTEYYQFYNRLLNDPRLLRALSECGYRMIFMPHPMIMPYIDRFRKNDQVAFGSLNTKYRDVYSRCKLVVTDYSSAVFDFAYLRKPVIYTQFDQEAFFSGEHVYTKGYFDYERDGFGEVETDLEGTVDRIIEYMENDCRLKDQYRARIDNFFAYSDQNNCERIYKRIMENNL